MEFLADEHRVDRVTPAAADRLRKFGSEQAGVGRPPVQVAGQLAGALPFRDVGQDLPFGEAAMPSITKFIARSLGRRSRVIGKSFVSGSNWRMASTVR